MKQRAFTLIEVLAGIVVIAIIAAIVAYSVITITEKMKLKGLNNSAINIRKTVKTYLTGKRGLTFDSNNILNMDLTPGCSGASCYSQIIKLDKDPWGKDYGLIDVKVTKISTGVFSIDIYIFLENSDWMLLNDSNELTTIPFVATNSIPNSTYFTYNNNVTINYELPYNFNLTNVALEVTKNGNPATEIVDYTIESFSTTKDAQNKYNVVLNIKTSGRYSVTITPIKSNRTGTPSNPILFRAVPPPIFLPPLLYFGSDNILKPTYGGTLNSFGFPEADWSAYTNSYLSASIRVVLKKANGSETIISDWRKAQATVATPYSKASVNASYSFPGSTEGDETDIICVDLGLSSTSVGAPPYYTRFTTGAVNATDLNPQTWTVYYRLTNSYDNDGGDDYHTTAFYYGLDTNGSTASRIVTSQ